MANYWTSLGSAIAVLYNLAADVYRFSPSGKKVNGIDVINKSCVYNSMPCRLTRQNRSSISTDKNGDQCRMVFPVDFTLAIGDEVFVSMPNGEVRAYTVCLPSVVSSHCYCTLVYLGNTSRTVGSDRA